MREVAGRHPFYLQLLGCYLVEARCDGSSVEDALERYGHYEGVVWSTRTDLYSATY